MKVRPTTVGGKIMNDEVEQAFRQGYITGRGDSLKCDDLRIEHIATYYGFTNQANMLCEEAAEFIVSLNKLRRSVSNIAYVNIKEEVADVLIIARQLRLLLGAEDIDRIVDEELNRQIRRIKEEDK